MMQLHQQPLSIRSVASICVACQSNPTQQECTEELFSSHGKERLIHHRLVYYASSAAVSEEYNCFLDCCWLMVALKLSMKDG